ncbi:MAG: hypothetical protein HXX12_15880 [Geothrix sp.]|uniref:hypothetical protein n=1 Tax=Geothrix sp. TaxID=1962974 RepID=UPI001791D221|nr:hypothetical protein [Geothrix sp.]NWJ42440.1 hypothetical protein [Geothrix sp.]WIL19596.1 MAG: hypothetical protein QOZ81_002119 [Geothrix sp.]
MLAAAPCVRADDAATAAGLVGTWEGQWAFADLGGKLVVKIASASGDTLKGESTWYGTAVGDFSDRFTKAKVKGREVKFPEPTMDFEATISEDGLTMTGTWTSPVASGKVTLTRKK